MKVPVAVHTKVGALLLNYWWSHKTQIAAGLTKWQLWAVLTSGKKHCETIPISSFIFRNANSNHCYLQSATGSKFQYWRLPLRDLDLMTSVALWVLLSLSPISTPLPLERLHPKWLASHLVTQTRVPFPSSVMSPIKNAEFGILVISLWQNWIYKSLEAAWCRLAMW
jgi:hypothetical protein